MWVPRRSEWSSTCLWHGGNGDSSLTVWAADRERADGHLCTHVGLQTSEHRTWVFPQIRRGSCSQGSQPWNLRGLPRGAMGHRQGKPPQDERLQNRGLKGESLARRKCTFPSWKVQLSGEGEQGIRGRLSQEEGKMLEGEGGGGRERGGKGEREKRKNCSSQISW